MMNLRKCHDRPGKSWKSKLIRNRSNKFFHFFSRGIYDLRKSRTVVAPLLNNQIFLYDYASNPTDQSCRKHLETILLYTARIILYWSSTISNWLINLLPLSTSLIPCTEGLTPFFRYLFMEILELFNFKNLAPKIIYDNVLLCVNDHCCRVGTSGVIKVFA